MNEERNKKGQFIKGHKFVRDSSSYSRGKNHHNWKGVSMCIICRVALSRTNYKFCTKHKFSEECREKMKNKRALMIGTKHPRWKGGYENKLYLNRKRRVNKIGNGGSHTLEDWEKLKRKYNYTCPSCLKEEPKIVLTEDHIVPLSKGGNDNIKNIQPLCRSCNSKKHQNIIKFNYKNYAKH